MTDYYAILGIMPGASSEQIRQAFLDLARKAHPDVRPNDAGAAARFKAIAEAHEVLSDSGKRRLYDRALAKRASSRTVPIFATQSDDVRINTRSSRGEPLTDRAERARSVGGSAEAGTVLDLPIAPEEALQGGEIRLNLRLPQPCPVCSKWENARACSACHSTRRVLAVYPTAILLPAGVREGTLVRLRGSGLDRIRLRVRSRACW